jgi:hypothetical protein
VERAMESNNSYAIYTERYESICELQQTAKPETMHQKLSYYHLYSPCHLLQNDGWFAVIGQELMI